MTQGADTAAGLRSILRRCQDGEISPAIALMEMLIATEDDAAVTELVRPSPYESPCVGAIRGLLAAHGAGCARVVAMVRSGVDSPPTDVSIAEGVAFCSRLFDWSVRQSEEASVALYSLGSPEILAEATREIVEVLERWGSLGREKRALDIGCGIGRMEVALAPRLGEIMAVDVSTEMLAVARERCAGLTNVTLAPASGLDLRAFENARFDLVFAVDSFPYLFQAGRPLVDTHVAEAARVLRPGGELVVLNLSYRDDVAADREDMASLAAAHAFEILVNGETPFRLWNGVAFRMRTPPRATR